MKKNSTTFSRVRVISLFFLLSPCFHDLHAQPELNFKRISLQWPQVVMHFQAKCAGTQRWDLTAQNFSIKENGSPILNFTLDVPDMNLHCCMSVALVIDRSGSMSFGTPSGLDGAKNGAKTFVDSLIQNCDQAALVTFNGSVTVDQSMTFDKTILKQKIDAITANGGTAAWDGAIAGIEEVINNGTQTCRAVVFLADGEDNASSHTASDVIALAQANNVRVYTIGLGTGIDDSDMQQIAIDTGGKYYRAPTPSQLVSIYQEIYRIISHHFEEATITYTGKCPDGSRMNIDLTLQNLSGCFGSDTKTKSYRSPRDSSQWTPIEFKLENASGYAKEDFFVPLVLDTPIDDILKMGSYKICFDPQQMSFSGIQTNGYIFERTFPGAYVMQSGVPGAYDCAYIQTKKDTLINGSGILCLLRFTAKDPPQDVATALTLSSSSDFVRCTKQTFLGSTVTITSRKPKLESCEIISSESIIFDKSLSSYYPTPFEVDVSVTNAGDREAKNVQAEISFDQTAFELVAGEQPKKLMNSGTVQPNLSAHVIWSFAPLPQAAENDFTITTTITSDNHTPVICSKVIHLEAFPPMLSIKIDPVDLQYDRVNAAYKPNPFPLNISVKNIGYVQTDFAQAEIKLPQGLELDAIERGRKKKYLSNYALAHDQSGNASWLLTHPITLEEKKYWVIVRTYAINADTVDESVEIVIPPMDGPELSCGQVRIPTSVAFDSQTKTYVNNPFTIEYAAINTGGLDADSVRAAIVLPSGFVLDPSTQSTIQYLNPMKVVRWKPQLQPNKISWTVRALPHYSRATESIQIKLNGITPIGTAMDEVTCSYPIDVDAFGKTKISCTAFGVDSVLFSPLLGLAPNPFPLCFNLKNESLLPVTVTEASIVQNVSGMLLESVTPKSLNEVLQPGAFVSVCATMRAYPMRVQRFGEIYLDYKVIEPVMELDQCRKTIFVDSSKLGSYPILTLTTTLRDSIEYDCPTKTYSPDIFTATAFINNGGNTIADSLQIKIELPNALELLVPSDSIRTVPNIYALLTEKIEWQMRVRTPMPVDGSFPLHWKLLRNQQEILIADKNIFIADSVCPSVVFSVPSLAFTIAKNDTTSYGSAVTIGSGDGTPFTWYASTPATWIALAPAQAQSGERLKVKLNQQNLAPGKYKSVIRIAVPTFNVFAELPVECEVTAVITSVEASVPGQFALEQNYPNPFSRSTTIGLVIRDWRLESTAHNTLIPNPRSLISFKVFDLFGREVLDLSDEARINSKLTIRNSQLPSPGIYFYRLTVGTQSQTKMMYLMR